MHVFVYGTLKKGYGNNRLLSGAIYVGKGETVEKFLMKTTTGFPVVLEKDKKASVFGEIYEINDAILETLDGLEGYPSMYGRKEVLVDIEGTGVQQTCWMYTGNPEFWGSRKLPEVGLNDVGLYNWPSEAKELPAVQPEVV